MGGVVGAVAGGLAGEGVAEAINPTDEDEYWRRNYASRPYVAPGHEYDAYRPAYRHGWESSQRHGGKSFDEAEPELRREWDATRGNAGMSWEGARDATRDAWHRARSPRRDREPR